MKEHTIVPSVHGGRTAKMAAVENCLPHIMGIVERRLALGTTKANKIKKSLVHCFPRGMR